MKQSISLGKRQVPTHIKDLVQDPQNRRAHNPRNIGMVVDALQQVGAARSIVIDENDVVLAGNGVTEAAAEAGITKVRVVEASGDEIIAVRRRGLSEEQKRSLAIYDNRTAELAEWNFEQLQADKAAGLSLQPFFSEKEEGLLLGTTVKSGLTPADYVPPARATDIRHGDIFQLGSHQIVCGDCTNVEDVRSALSGRAAFGFTSPPYVDQREYGAAGRDMSVEHLSRFITLIAKRVDLMAVNLGLARRDGAIHRYWDAYISSAEASGLRLLSWNIWHQGVQGSVGKLTAMFPIEHEFVFIFGDARKSLNKTIPNKTAGDVRGTSDRQRDGSTLKKPTLQVAERRALGTVLQTPPENGRSEETKDHPARFPVDLVVPYLEACSDAGDLVYDSFLGSGTTLIACEQTGRYCRGLEIEPRWTQMAIDRWEAFTGQKAQKVGEAVST